MSKKLSKSNAETLINNFFKNTNKKDSKQIKKIKKAAMNKNLKLNEKRKLFCKKCLSPYKNNKIRIKKGFKIINCKKCGKINRWKIKSS